MKLLIATTNAGKLIEIRNILSGLPLSIESLENFPNTIEAVEDGLTFEENARKKATHYAHLTPHLTVAEDSGLEIEALNGRPGVLSARYNGSSSYQEKFAAINKELNKKGTRSSDARFVCALAVAIGTEVIFEATGTIEGRLANEPTGSSGFGYDPIFFYPPYGKTLAEVSAEKKAAVSHRGQAFRKLRRFLQTY